MIHVVYRGKLAELTGCTTEELQAARVSDVLTHIKKDYGKEAWREASRLLITVDQKSVTLMQNLRTALPDGCTVAFLTICGGG